jgi:hypothetical protein
MEDLASVVLTKLRVDDGPSPFCLLYRYRCINTITNVMCVRAVRKHGATAYEVALCNDGWCFKDGGEGNEWDPDSGPMRPHSRWQIALFENEKVAAAFAMAFVNLQPRSHRDGDTVMFTYTRKDVAHLFQWKPDGTCDSLGPAFTNGDLYLEGAKTLGKHTISCAADLQAAMLTLMPLSARLY